MSGGENAAGVCANKVCEVCDSVTALGRDALRTCSPCRVCFKRPS